MSKRLIPCARVTGPFAGAGLTAALVAGLALPGFADDFTWTGLAGDGDWQNAGNWLNTSVVPTDTNGIPDADDAASFPIDATTTGGTAGDLSIDALATLSLGVGTVTVNGGSITNDGVLTFAGDTGTSSNETLGIVGAVTLGGVGELVLVEQSDSFIQNSGGAALTNAAGHTIRGTGTLGSSLDFVNEGVIVAEGGTLEINTPTTNSGTVQIAADGRLQNDGTFTGGTVSGVAGALLAGGGTYTTTFEGVLGVASGDTAVLTGLVTNNAVFTLLEDTTTSTNSSLGILGATTLAGNGTLVLTEANDSFIQNYGGAALTNAAGHTIRGTGTLGSSLDLVNEGLIVAEGGTLEVDTVVDNTGGVVQIAADGRLQNDGTFTGGTVSGVAGALLAGSGTYSTTFEGALGVASGDTAVLTGLVTNNAVFTLLEDTTTSTNSALGILGATTLAGNGTVVLTEANDSFIQNYGGAALTNAAGHTIRGTGTLSSSLDLVNQGLIVAEGGTLEIDTAVDNTGGVVQIAADGRLQFDAPVTGGSLSGAAGSELSGSGTFGGTFTGQTLARGAGLDGATNNGVVTVGPGNFTLTGTITNNGTIATLGDTGTSTNETLGIVGVTTLAGNGTVVLTEANDSFIQNFSGAALTNAAGHTIRGTGTLGGNIDLVNEGLIVAEGGTLEVDTAVDNTGGVVQIASDGQLQNDNALTGGTVSGVGGALLAGSGTYTTTFAGELGVASGQSVVLTGTITNNAVITLLEDTSTSSNSTVGIRSATTLAGTGELVLTEEDDSMVQNFSGAALTNAAGHTIRGTGTLGSNLGLVNQGTITAEGGTLTITSAFSQQSGRLAAAGGATLSLNGNPLLVEGGTLGGDGTILGNVQNQGGIAAPGMSPGMSPGTLTIDGNYTQDVDAALAIEISSAAAGQADLLTVTGDATLGGTLDLALVDGFAPAVFDAFTIVTSDTLNGSRFDAVQGAFYQPGRVLSLTYTQTDVLLTASVLGDLNGDGALTNGDISAFVLALTDPAQYQATYPDLNPQMLGDFDQSGSLTNGDIAGFVNALTGGSASASAVPEPGSLALLACGGLLAIRRRRGASPAPTHASAGRCGAWEA